MRIVYFIMDTKKTLSFDIYRNYFDFVFVFKYDNILWNWNIQFHFQVDVKIKWKYFFVCPRVENMETQTRDHKILSFICKAIVYR